MVDLVETPIQENKFYLGNIKMLLDNIIDEFS